MMKGKIVEVNKKSITLMTSDMNFVKVKTKQSAEIGKEVFYFEEDVLVSRHLNNAMKYVVAAVVMIAMFIGVSTFNVPTKPLISTINFESEVVAVVSLDINPSIEIELDKNLKVVNAISRNNDGNAILDIELIKGKYITIAIKDMLKLAKDELFLNEVSNTVLITTAPTENLSSENSDELEKQMKNLAMESSDEEIEFVVASAPMNTLVEARELEVSLGKLNVYDNLDAKDKDVSLVEIESKKVVDIKDEGYLEDTSYTKFRALKIAEKITIYKYVIKDGVEYGNSASFEDLGVTINIVTDKKIILASVEDKDDFSMKYEYGVLVKDGECYYNLKDVLDNFGFSFTYEGSKFVLDKAGENLVLDYVGEGIKVFESFTKIQDTAVKIDSTTDIIESTEVANGSNYDMIVSTGTEWISEKVFATLGFEFEHLDKTYVRYDVISYEIDQSIIRVLDGVKYYETKTMLDLLGVEYGYTDEGFYIKTEEKFNLVTDIFEGEVKFESYK